MSAIESSEQRPTEDLTFTRKKAPSVWTVTAMASMLVIVPCFALYELMGSTGSARVLMCLLIGVPSLTIVNVIAVLLLRLYRDSYVKITEHELVVKTGFRAKHVAFDDIRRVEPTMGETTRVRYGRRGQVDIPENIVTIEEIAPMLQSMIAPQTADDQTVNGPAIRSFTKTGAVLLAVGAGIVFVVFAGMAILDGDADGMARWAGIFFGVIGPIVYGVKKSGQGFKVTQNNA